jgi:hypothetical protein
VRGEAVVERAFEPVEVGRLNRLEQPIEVVLARAFEDEADGRRSQTRALALEEGVHVDRCALCGGEKHGLAAQRRGRFAGLVAGELPVQISEAARGVEADRIAKRVDAVEPLEGADRAQFAIEEVPQLGYTPAQARGMHAVGRQIARAPGVQPASAAVIPPALK